MLVLLHGLIMNGAVWRYPVAKLQLDFRWILPKLPLGAHRAPLRPTPISRSADWDG